LTDGIHLGSVTTPIDTDTDIDIGKLVKPDNEEGLVDLESEDLWLHEGKGRSVDLDETTASLVVGLRVSHLLFLSSIPSVYITNLAVGDGGG